VIRKILICFAFVLAVQAFAPAAAAAQCGGAGQVPCYDWSWCSYTTPSLFGDVCWGGFVASGPNAGCNSDRLNNWGLVCVPCGGAGEPTCNYGTTCNTDQRYTPFLGVCYACGESGQAQCLSGASCDVGNRPVFGFCSYSGFSEEPSTNVPWMPTMTQSATEPVRGIADLHTHQFSNLGFGGVVFWGAPFDWRGVNSALAWCDYTFDFSTELNGVDGPMVPSLGYEIHGPKTLQALSHPLSNAFPEGQHEVGGTGPFDGWPTYNTTTHQQMYYKWLERAYLGGVRLITQHMVSNEALCGAGKRRDNFTCNDMDAVDKQIQATKELEWAVDFLDDHQFNNSGWYRIAYSPGQARQIIRAGKLAVVLGIEVDSLFDCKPGSTTCTRAYLKQKLQDYYGRGIRHVFPIHQFDNAFGGAALFRDELNAGNVRVTNSHFTVRDCSADNAAPDAYNYNVDKTDLDLLTWLTKGYSLPPQDTYDKSKADCNARGLTATGKELIEEMMDLKFIIDTDHMSRLMVDEVMTMAKTTSDDRPNKYPLVSSHTGFLSKQAEKSEFSVTDAQLAVFKEIGGMVTAAIPWGGCAEGFKAGYKHAVLNMRKDDTDKFPGVAFSTDVNGFAGSLAPCATGLVYPFTGVMGGTFNQQTTGNKTFNFNTDGGAHYGLYADFFASLKLGTSGLTNDELDPLLNSAETYIRLWEKVDSSDKTPPPTINAVVTGTQGTNGWYRSDVTVTWDISMSEFAEGAPTTSGCESRTITTDTGGTTITCKATNPSGESSQSTVIIRRDVTPPTFTASRLTASLANGWINTDVSVEFTATDNRSGIGGANKVTVKLTREGKDQIASYLFYDRAGNTVEATLGGISIDKTRPRIGFRFAHLPENPPATPEQMQAEHLKWHNHAVTLIVDAQDDLSGIESVTPTQLVFTTEGGNQRKFATVVDKAGNSVSDDNDGIRIDLTPPVLTLDWRLPAANEYGWNKTPVDLQWWCGDMLSGVVVSPRYSRRVESEGAAQTATVTCFDKAGNSTSNTVGNINIDMTPPTLTYAAPQPAANANGWHRTDVAIPYIVADALSGVLETNVPSPLMLTREGAATIGLVWAFDRAYNDADFYSPPMKIDKTPPAITFVSRLPEANVNGWNNRDITAQWTCADGLSGVVSPNVSQTLSTEGANLSLTGTCADLASNSKADTRGGLSLDKTPPVVQCVADPAALFPPNNQLRPVTVGLTFTDALAGTWSYAMNDLSSNEAVGASEDITGFTIGSTALAGSLRAQRVGNGLGRFYTLGYEGRDRAGNTAVCSTKVTVPHDGTQQQQQ
jgi:microsomal dipeptidase-like Zn-dependent dipeptidase